MSRANDYTTVKYSPDGGAPISIFHYDYSELPGYREYPTAMVVAPLGIAAVPGRVTGADHIFFMIMVLSSGDDEVVAEMSTQPVFIPVLNFQANAPSSVREGKVTYTYEWTISSGENVFHPDKVQAEDMLYEGKNGTDFTPEPLKKYGPWPSRRSGGLAGPSFTSRFSIEDCGAVFWGHKPALGDAVYTLQTLSGVKK